MLIYLGVKLMIPEVSVQNKFINIERQRKCGRMLIAGKSM
jgi:hypothetical protein